MTFNNAQMKTRTKMTALLFPSCSALFPIILNLYIFNRRGAEMRDFELLQSWTKLDRKTQQIILFRLRQAIDAKELKWPSAPQEKPAKRDQ
ncbi:hypothetical protein Bcsk_012720 [Bartonella sp. CDC_skunk]|nr:hypothetical protein Bcsk_012720 [Bartonella sp. CDC_skunk]